MKIIGLTGGIGSGKSVVAKILESRGIPVYDTDKEAKRITSGSPVVRKALSDQFGNDLYPNGLLDTARLSALIFNNEENLRYVNSVIHPEVRNDFLLWQKHHQAIPFVAVESAILFESGFDKTVDIIINVSAPLETRIERIEKRNQLSREAILNRIQNQLSDEEREKKSNYTLVNDNSQALLPQIENMLNEWTY